MSDQPDRTPAQGRTERLSVPYPPEGEAVQIVRDLIRIDTSNFGDSSGPGEREAAELVAALLDEVGIDSVILESEPGRATVVAQWGNRSSSRPGLLIHGHLDVVPAQGADWRVDPFAGEIVDDCLYGRGAVDMKDFDGMLLSVVRARQRAGAVPDRPITLVFTADEEAGGMKGAHWLVSEHPELLDGCTEAIGEIGGFSTTIGGRRLYLVESGEKGIAWIRLTARGTSGHGSMRQSDNALEHLARGLVRLSDHEWPAELGPSMTRLVDVVAELSGETSADPEAVLAHVGPAIRMIGSGIRNSANVTMLSAGYKHNVVPGEAIASVDGRYLPGHRDAFLSQVAGIVGEQVQVQIHHEDRALEYRFDGDLVDAMTTSLLLHDPGAAVAPYLLSAGSDAKAWDRLGIACYGFVPLALPDDLDFTALFHGADERVPIGALEHGARVFDTFLGLC